MHLSRWTTITSYALQGLQHKLKRTVHTQNPPIAVTTHSYLQIVIEELCSTCYNYFFSVNLPTARVHERKCVVHDDV